MGPVVKLYIYKAALALNDNKSVSITCVVARVSGGLPPLQIRLVLWGELGCSPAWEGCTAPSFLLPLRSLQLLGEKITRSSLRFNVVHSKG